MRTTHGSKLARQRNPSHSDTGPSNRRSHHYGAPTDPDYLELFGPEAGQGAQTNPWQIWWLVCAGPVGEGADRERQRMLAAYRTMPHSARPAFLKRLHSIKTDDAFGAISELEYAALLLESGVSFSWGDPLAASVAQQRNVDFSLPNGLHAEVTTLNEPEVPPQFRQLFLALGRENALPPGVYAVTVGEGSPPVRRLRAKSGKHCGADHLW